MSIEYLDSQTRNVIDIVVREGFSKELCVSYALAIQRLGAKKEYWFESVDQTFANTALMIKALLERPIKQEAIADLASKVDAEVACPTRDDQNIHVLRKLKYAQYDIVHGETTRLEFLEENGYDIARDLNLNSG